MSDGELVADLAGLEALAPEWDALAVDASNPVAAPAWILSWLRYAAPPDLEPRVVIVRDRGTLVGVAPFYVARSRLGVVEYSLMASGFGAPMEPLALAGREWDVAGEVARLLASCRPRPDVVAFGPMSFASPWTAALGRRWPGAVSGLVRRGRVEEAPVIVLREPSFEAWFASLSSNTRSKSRRSERLFAEAGGTTRWSTAETLHADAKAFARLHADRWAGRAWSRLAELGSRSSEWLEDLGRDLIEEGRFQMCMLEVEGSPICADFHLIAGAELSCINMGWDVRYSKLAPGKLAMLRVVEGAYGWGCRRLSLGVGSDGNKLTFANGNDPPAWTLVMPPSLRLPYTYAHVLPRLVRAHARDAAARVLPPEWLKATRDMRRRLRDE
jgi:CelD/BcsL family acetyltransferase involved in cellulose biosynthesis